MKGSTLGALAALAIVMAGLTLWFSRASGDTPSTSPFPRANVPFEQQFFAKVKDFGITGPNNLRVKLRYINTGDASAVGECDVVAYDKAAAIMSFPVSSGQPVEPGYGIPVTADLKFRGAKAQAVKRVEVSC